MRSAGGDLSHVSQAHAAYLDATRRLLMEHMVDSTLSRFAAQQQQQRRNVIVNNSSSKSSADESEFGAASSTADCATEISIINQNSRAHSPSPPSQQQQPNHPTLYPCCIIRASSPTSWSISRGPPEPRPPLPRGGASPVDVVRVAGTTDTTKKIKFVWLPFVPCFWFWGLLGLSRFHKRRVLSPSRKRS